MEDLTKTIRKYIFDRLLETSLPPVIEEIMHEFKMRRNEAYQVLQTLQAGRHLAMLSGTQRILMVWPFSAIPSPFRVTLANGKTYFANCSWDSIAFHVMLQEPVKVNSLCHHCGEGLDIELRNQTVASLRPKGTAVYIGVPASKWWEDIVSTCSNNMSFFSSREHWREWAHAEREELGELITVEQALMISDPLYRERVTYEYARPSREVIMERFQSAGLRSGFWKL